MFAYAASDATLRLLNHESGYDSRLQSAVTERPAPVAFSGDAAGQIPRVFPVCSQKMAILRIHANLPL